MTSFCAFLKFLQLAGYEEIHDTIPLRNKTYYLWGGINAPKKIVFEPDNCYKIELCFNHRGELNSCDVV